MKIIPAISVGLLLALAFGGGYFAGNPRLPVVFGYEASDLVEKGETAVTATRKVVAQGRIVPHSGLIHVMAPPGQKIVEIKVIEGDLVKAGETELATHLGQQTLALQSQLAESQIEDAKRELSQKILTAESNKLVAENAVATSDMQLTRAKEGVELSINEKRLSFAKSKLERMVGLSKDPSTELFVSKTAIEEQRMSIEQAEWELNNARRQQEAAIHAASLSMELAQKSLNQAETVLQTLEKMRDENLTLTLAKQIADAQVSNARLLAPIDGTVLKIFARPGEVVVNSPLMQLGDLTKMNCTVEVLDRLVSKVVLKQRVSILCPALANPIEGEVVEIGRMVGAGSLIAPNPLAVTERNTVEVRIKIDEKDNAIARNLVNLQVTVDIFTDEAK